MTATHNLNRLCFLELNNADFEEIEHSFFYIRMLFFQARLNFLIFLSILGKCSCRLVRLPFSERNNFMQVS